MLLYSYLGTSFLFLFDVVRSDDLQASRAGLDPNLRLCRDRQLTDRFAFLKHQTIHLFALVESAKRLACLTFVAVDLPAAAAFAVLAAVLDVAHDIAGRIAQKETDLMGKISGAINALREVCDRALRRKVGVAEFFEHAGCCFVRKVECQLPAAIDINQRAVCSLADHRQADTLDRQQCIQMQKLRFQFVFGRKAVIKEICGFERRQCRRTVIDQILFHEKPVSFPMSISYFTLLTAAKMQGDKTQRFTRFSLRRKRRMVVGTKVLRQLQKPIADSLASL